VRGNAQDYDGWEALGARGWAYRDVLPYFKRAETREEGGDAYRGSDGPLHTSYGTLKNPLYRAFIDAAVQAGYPETSDINGYQQEGFGRARPHHPRRQARRSAGERLIDKLALERPNASLVDRALATRCWRSRRARRPRRLSPGRRRRRGAGKARGDSGRRADRFAATADAVGHSCPGGVLTGR
jgi:choline dehydrogenase